jgi:hypothetical protein
MYLIVEKHISHLWRPTEVLLVSVFAMIFETAPTILSDTAPSSVDDGQLFKVMMNHFTSSMRNYHAGEPSVKRLRCVSPPSATLAQSTADSRLPTLLQVDLTAWCCLASPTWACCTLVSTCSSSSLLAAPYVGWGGRRIHLAAAALTGKPIFLFIFALQPNIAVLPLLVLMPRWPLRSGMRPSFFFTLRAASQDVLHISCTRLTLCRALTRAWVRLLLLLLIRQSATFRVAF